MYSTRCRVREKDDGSYVVSLSHGQVVWHYSVDVRVSDRRHGAAREKLRIENGPAFDNLMDVRTRHCHVTSVKSAIAFHKSP